MRIEKLVWALSLFALPALSFATLDDRLDISRVPEPETLGLIAGAAVAWAIVRWRKRK